MIGPQMSDFPTIWTTMVIYSNVGSQCWSLKAKLWLIAILNNMLIYSKQWYEGWLSMVELLNPCPDISHFGQVAGNYWSWVSMVNHHWRSWQRWLSMVGLLKPIKGGLHLWRHDKAWWQRAHWNVVAAPAGDPRLPIENGTSTELARISHACTPQLDSFISSSLLFLTAIFKTCQMWW